MNPSDNAPDTNNTLSQETEIASGDVSSTLQAADYPTDFYKPKNTQSDGSSHHIKQEQPEPKVVVDNPPVTWTAREDAEHTKRIGWYMTVVAVALGLIVVDILLLKSYTFTALVVVMVTALIVYTRRPAREVKYTLSSRQGLYVGERLYHLADFRAFGLVKDGDRHSVVLLPTKRLAPGVSVYFPEEVGEQIVDILGQQLPMETLKPDAFDALIKKLRL